MRSENPFDEFISQYRERPALFVQEMWGYEPFD